MSDTFHPDVQNPGLLAPSRKPARKRNRLDARPGERDITHEVTIVAPQSPLDANPDDVGAQDDLLDEAEALSNTLMELGEGSGGAVVKIWRVDRFKKESAFIDEIVPQEFTLKWLKDEHGGGIYRVRVYVPQRDDDGSLIPGRVKLAANKQIIVDGAPRVKRETEHAVIPAQNHELLVLGFTKMSEAMSSGFQQIAQMVAAKDKPQTMNDMLQTMLLFKQVLGGAPAADPMAMMSATMKIVKDMTETAAIARGGDDEGGGGGVGGVIVGKLFERVMDSIGQLQKTPQVSAPELPAFPAPGVELPTAPPSNVVELHAPQPAPEETEMGLQQMLMSAALSDVLKNAERNTPPVEYAASIYDDAPDALLDFLSDENWHETVKAFNPKAALYPVWLKAVRDELLRLDAEPDGGPEASA